MKSYTILAPRWYNNMDGCVGVVAIQTFEDEWKAYIGLASGFHQEMDEQHVAACGNGLAPEEAHGFFPYLDIEKYKAY